MTDLDLYDVNRNLHLTNTLIGEDRTVLVAFAAYLFSRQPVIIQGLSGSGKTITSDSVIDLIPDEALIEIQVASKKSIFNMADEFNDSEYLYVPEAQKATDNLELREMLKSFGEGKPFTHTKSVRADEDSDDDWTTQTITVEPMPFLTTLADENEDLDLGEELERRAIIMYSDPSQEQTEKVLEEKLEDYSSVEPRDTPNAEVHQEIQNRVGQLMQWETLPDVALPGIDEAFIDHIPTKFHVSRSVIDHFLNVVSGVARFHYLGGNRIYYNDHIIATPQDLFEAFEIYSDTLMNNCLKLEEIGNEVLAQFPQSEEGKDGLLTDDWKRSAKDVMEALEHQGLVVPKSTVKQIISNLLMAGYLEEDSEMRPTHYYRTGIARNSNELIIDWAHIVDTIEEAAEAVLSADEYGEWDYPQEFKHPVSGEPVDLQDHVTDQTEADDDVEVAQDTPSSGGGGADQDQDEELQVGLEGWD